VQLQRNALHEEVVVFDQDDDAEDAKEVQEDRPLTPEPQATRVADDFDFE
jgi:hypothetical protein